MCLRVRRKVMMILPCYRRHYSGERAAVSGVSRSVRSAFDPAGRSQGWVVAEWGTSSNNRRARFYRLTPSGRKQLSAEHFKWERFSEALARILCSARGAQDV